MVVDGWPSLLLLLAVTMAGAVAGPLIVLLLGVKLHAVLARRKETGILPIPVRVVDEPSPRPRMPPIWERGDGPIV